MTLWLIVRGLFLVLLLYGSGELMGSLIVDENGQLHYEDDSLTGFPIYRNNFLVNVYKEFSQIDPIEIAEWRDVTDPSFWNVDSYNESQLNDGMIWDGIKWIVRPIDSNYNPGNWLAIKDNWNQTGWIYGIRVTFTADHKITLYAMSQNDEICHAIIGSESTMPIWAEDWLTGKPITHLQFAEALAQPFTDPYTLAITKIEVRQVPFQKNVVPRTIVDLDTGSSAGAITGIRYSADDFIQACFQGLSNNFYHAFYNGTSWTIDNWNVADRNFGFPVKFGTYYGFLWADTSDSLKFKYYNGSWQEETLGTLAYAGPVWAEVDTAGVLHVITFGNYPQKFYHYWRDTGGTWYNELASTPTWAPIGSNIAWCYLDSSDKIHLMYYDMMDGSAYSTNASGSWVREIAADDMYMNWGCKGRNDYPTYVFWESDGHISIRERIAGTWTKRQLLIAATALPQIQFYNGVYQLLLPYGEQYEEVHIPVSTWIPESKGVIPTQGAGSVFIMLDHRLVGSTIVGTFKNSLVPDAENHSRFRLDTFKRSL